MKVKVILKSGNVVFIKTDGTLNGSFLVNEKTAKELFKRGSVMYGEKFAIYGEEIAALLVL